MTFWYMQVHPSDQPREFNSEVMYASILRTRDVGIGDEQQWGKEGIATQDRFKNDVKPGDIAVIAHGKKLMLLVRFGKYGRNRDKSDHGHWYGLKRDVDILSADNEPFALEFAKRFGKAASDGLPIRQTLVRIRSNDFVRFWYDQVMAGAMELSRVGDVPALISVASREVWRRNSEVADRVRAKGVCEVCGTKETFINNDGRQYFEGHHLIQMSRQSLFKVSLDVPSNVVCLCPKCHRFLHFGRVQDRKLFLMKIYRRRADDLVKAGISKSEMQFLRQALGNTND